MDSSYQALLQYSFRLLGRKSYTETEIADKLSHLVKRRKLIGAEGAAEKVISRLRELGYIDDKKILENYFEYRLQSRPQGKFAFLHEMHRRGIPFEQARGEWEKRGVEEKPLARALVEKRSRLFAKMPLVLRKKKIASLLAGRGFSPETVWGILDELDGGWKETLEIMSDRKLIRSIQEGLKGKKKYAHESIKNEF